MSLYRVKSRRRVSTDGFGKDSDNDLTYKRLRDGSLSKKDAATERAIMRRQREVETDKRCRALGIPVPSQEQRRVAWLRRRHYLYKLGKKHGVHLK